MRIVIDMQGAQTASRYRGIGRYTMAFAQAVVRNRGEHEIVLALSGLFPDTIEPIRDAFDGLLPQENIRIWHAPGPVKEEQAGNETRRAIAEIIREAFLASLQADIIHVSSLFEGYVDDAVTSIGRFDRATPVSVILYDLIPLLNTEHYLAPYPRYGQYYRHKVEYFERSAICLAISEFTRQEGLDNLDYPESRIANISTGIDPAFHLPRIDDDAASLRFRKFGLVGPFILYAGGADERKNLLRLIEAYASLPAVLRESHQLVFAGKMSDGDVARFRQQARSIGLKPEEMCFTGYVSDEELLQLYSQCKLFVFPSWHEGFGLPALEAMACGAPVIGANTSSLPEVIGVNEALFDPFEVRSIAAKMKQALEDDVFRARLRAHGLQQARLFSWDKTAGRAIVAWERFLADRGGSLSAIHSVKGKPKLAFVSPLPPERTGIADYSVELLPALAEYYDIEVVVAQDRVDDPWVNRYLKVRDVSWLRAHVSEVDRVLYQIGNSPFHKHMLPLLQEIPGTVVLHDFYLSGLMAWLELDAGEPYAWTKALYEAHGYDAVRERYRDAAAAKRKYPVNLHVLQHAQGVIVHSEYSRQLARQWYGAGISDGWKTIPHLRVLADQFEKTVVRKQLGFDKEDFVICSFGFLDPTKLNHRLLNCWLGSALARDRRCYLVFVGENHSGDYGANLMQAIRTSGLGNRIRITGFASPEIFRQYLMAADMAVQLRTQSRGETSGTVLDCMNHALPVIVNANGSMAELDREAVWMLPDEFADVMLVEALDTLRREPEKRQALGERAREIIFHCHVPIECAKRYVEAIERFCRQTEPTMPALIRAIATQNQFAPCDTELLQLSQSIDATLPLSHPAKRLYLDVTATSRNNLKTGIERVVRALTLALLESPPEGYRIEPVYLSYENGAWYYRHARRYTLGMIGCPVDSLEDEIAEPECGDILLGMDLSGDTLIQAEHYGLFRDYRNRGVSVYAIVFDLLPVRLPEVFPPGADQMHQKWLEAISKFDGAVCISKTVADDLRSWQAERSLWESRRPYVIGWFHLGADVANAAPTRGIPLDAERTLKIIKTRPSFLMVGTIEPRKGYMQTLNAFNQLWRDGVDVNLVIVGLEGWKTLPDNMRRDIPQTVECLRTHPELNKRLFWLEGISDEYLEKVYSASTCLIAASYGEGFGLPLIEAAQHKLPIIARDIPVFREVAGEFAYYFDAPDGKDLCGAVKEWLAGGAGNNTTKSQGISEVTNWKQSANMLMDKIINGAWLYRRVSQEIGKKAIDGHLELIHRARVQMVSCLLPQGDVILDLGGANCPLYKMGYPHKFRKLYLIDLPPEDRHDMYKEIVVDPNCDGGEVVIQYGDMTELSAFPDASADFVWSGQSIEHVPLEAGLRLCQAAYRVLRPGGFFCLDTPNRFITQIHTRDAGGGFIHPEHYIEYESAQLRGLLEEAGFIVQKALGICEMTVTAQSGHFDYTDFLYGKPITDKAEQSYILYFHCVKP